MVNKDKIMQEEMRKHYDESSYYEDFKHNYADKKSRFKQYTIKNVLEIYSPLENEKIIDVGCGWGNISFTLQKKGFDVIGIDYFKKSIDMCKNCAKKLGLDENKFLCRDATDTKLSANSIDVVYCADLVEHLYPEIYLALLKEINRILKNGGKFIVYTPNPSHILEILKNHNIVLKKDITHVDYKNMHRLRKSISSNGFVISKSYYIESHLPFVCICEKLFMNFIPLFRRRNAILAIKQ